MKKNKLINAVIIGAIIIMVLMVILIVRTANDIMLINEEIQEQRTTLEKKYQEGKLLRKSVEQLAEISPMMTQLQSIILPSDNALAFVNDLETEAEKTGVELIINIPAFESKEKIQSTPLRLSISGTPEKILAFINILDTRPFYINIHNLRLTSQLQRLKAPLSATAQIEANIYWR